MIVQNNFTRKIDLDSGSSLSIANEEDSLIDKDYVSDYSNLYSIKQGLDNAKSDINQVISDDSNKEQSISDALLGSINDAALELEILNGWTEGGKAMFSSIISGMFDEISKDGIQGIELEDTLQLIILELMVNSDKYGLSEWVNDPKIKPCIEHLLESIGSGSHGLHEHENQWDQVETLAKAAGFLLNELNKKGPFDSTTLLGRLLTQSGFDNSDGIEKLYNNINNNYHHGDGWLIYDKEQQNGSSAAKKVSPLITMMIMADILKIHPDITREDMEILLSRDIFGIEKIMANTLKSPASIKEWINRDGDKWQIQTGEHDKGGHGGQLDWIGNGLNLKDLENIYNNFPSRVLSDEDIKEINRIGDNVKMIMQTLKYWFQIMRDERVAIARNI
ncbi:TPA: molecular chaperone [Vibrio cholerae]|nr:molecular chaperone [Vibrio cholerae]